jgi:hypothetical protein
VSAREHFEQRDERASSQGRGGARVARLLELGWVLLVGAAAVWAAGVHLLGPALPYDDAFIIFRYVDNLVAGNGLVYNVGERVFGASTPAYVFWLAGFKLLFPSVPTPLLAVRSNLLLFLFAAASLAALAARVSSVRGLPAALAALFLANPQLLAISTGGMETIGAMGLTLAAATAALAGRPVLFGLSAGFAVVTRPEGAVLLAPFLFYLWWSVPNRKALLAACLIAALPGLAWAIFGTVYFGTPIPHSVVAKSQPLYPLPAGAALRRIARWAAHWLAPGAVEGGTRAVTAALAAGLAAAIAGALAPRDERAGGAMLVYLWAAPVLLYAVGNPLFFEWYWPLVFVPTLLLLVVGWQRGLQLIASRWREGRAQTRIRLAVPWLVPAALALVTLVHWTSSVDDLAEPIPWQLVESDPSRVRILGYQAAAEALNDLAGDGETVAAPEIGSLGYYYRGPVLDACGLVTPEAVPFLPVPPEQRLGPMFGAISVEFVQQTKPDWVVTMPVFALRSLLRSPWFEEHYVPVAQVPLPLPCWGSRRVVLFRLR